MKQFRKLLSASFCAFVLSLLALGCDTSIDPVGTGDGAEDSVTEDSGPVCGNGIAEAGEECDDGENNSDTIPDACRTDCTEPRCGDGVIDSDEACEGSNTNGETCESITGFSGSLSCSTLCQFDTSLCPCGNDTCEYIEDQFSCPADCGVVDITTGGSGCYYGPPSGLGCENTGHVYTVLVDGKVKGWGSGFGNIPKSVFLGAEAVVVSTGSDHACALLSDRTVLCWWSNPYGNPASNPEAVSGLEDVISVSVGSEHACAVLSNRTAVCWGWGYNEDGQLGDGTNDPSNTPVEVAGLTDVLTISSGEKHSCAVISDGTAWCWGNNGSGQLGDGTNINSNVPVPVAGLIGAVMISAGEMGGPGTIGLDHTCALLHDGTAMCWGSNVCGVLGDGTHTNSNVPVPVLGLTGVVAISTGPCLTCAVLSDGNAKCWGSNTSGELGDGIIEHPDCEGGFFSDCSNIPVTVTGLNQAVGIAVGGTIIRGHACAVLSDGTAMCWGNNEEGQLGDGIVDHPGCGFVNDVGVDLHDCSSVPVLVTAW